MNGAGRHKRGDGGEGATTQSHYTSIAANCRRE